MTIKNKEGPADEVSPWFDKLRIPSVTFPPYQVSGPVNFGDCMFTQRTISSTSHRGFINHGLTNTEDSLQGPAGDSDGEIFPESDVRLNIRPAAVLASAGATDLEGG